VFVRVGENTVVFEKVSVNTREREEGKKQKPTRKEKRERIDATPRTCAPARALCCSFRAAFARIVVARVSTNSYLMKRKI
jgi:hypothetical protein